MEETISAFNDCAVLMTRNDDVGFTFVFVSGRDSALPPQGYEGRGYRRVRNFVDKPQNLSVDLKNMLFLDTYVSSGIVVVTKRCQHRGDALQLVEDGMAVDVPGVKDQVNAFESVQYLLG